MFVINSPQTPDIKADVMNCVQRSRSVCLLRCRLDPGVSVARNRIFW